VDISIVLWPIKWLIEVILVSWHWIWSHVGFDADWGITWILSIVGLTIVVRAALIPLFVRQIKSQRRMMLIQPEMKRIQDKYRGKRDQFSREAMTREMSALYKKHGTNPLSSCVPLLVQMPIFISLFFVMNSAANFHPEDPTSKPGIDGGWMTPDLANSFRLSEFFGAPLHTSIQAANGNVAVWVIAITMIVLMTGSQFFTQLQIMSKNMSAETKASPMYRQQRVLLYILPFVFVFSSWAFPIGVMFYWVASNLWTLGQQWVVIRSMPTPGSEAALEREARIARRNQRRGIQVIEDDGDEPPVPAPKTTQRQQPVNNRRRRKGGRR